MDKTKKYDSVSDYLNDQPSLQKERLEAIRSLVKRLVPEATEKLSYNMPAFFYGGVLLYYAAHKNHIGFYPGSVSSLEHFSGELKSYKTSKGTVQIQNSEELPLELLGRIIIYRHKEKQMKLLSRKKTN
jgi:uncharacterized protein YdhG (YjbR/CyaY superfamily)